MSMKRTCATLTVILASATAAGPSLKLDGTRVGVYGTDFEFTTLSVLKVGAAAADNPARLRAYAERLRRNHERGRFNLFGLYVADRVKYARPVEECNRAAAAIVAGVGRENVDAVFLSEENVPTRQGLTVLNGLYGHLKEKWPNLPVFQWLSAPLGPSPELKADGWMYDFYRQKRSVFRRKLTRYIVTGKPVVMCLNASPDVARFEDPFGGAVTQEQLNVCREFNVPVFFYCVDLRWGNPDIWRISSAPELTAWRNWLLQAVDELRGTAASTVPRLSAEYVDGSPLEAAPDAKGRFEFVERFAAPSFLDRWSVRGFGNIAWSSAGGGRVIVRQRSRRFGGVEMYLQIKSEFDMQDPRVRLDLAKKAGSDPGVRLLLSATGHNWPRTAVPERSTGAKIEIDAVGDERFHSREFWVQVRLGEPAESEERGVEIDGLRFACRVTPPAKPGVLLRADRTGTVSYQDRFQSAKYRWLAEVRNAAGLEWESGRLFIRGVKGRVNRVTVCWPFSSEKPLRDIAVAVDARANRKNLGGVIGLAVSLDGKTWLHEVRTDRFKADANGWERGTLRIDTRSDERFRGVRSFRVRVEMVNGCGLKTSPSNIVTGLDVRAQVKR
ncbi:MAG: hypothetical protein GXP31_01745 [Kiritimatiellaeota bacterium]|nr:hypothetical protein [Kiritimatiellota bacterium]